MGKKPNAIDIEVGRRIRIARKQAGLSQAEIGKAVGVSFQAAGKYESGVTRVSSARLLAIAEKLGKPIAWFFGEEDRKPGADAIAQMLALPHGLELAAAYIAISDNKDRQTVLQVARGLAGHT